IEFRVNGEYPLEVEFTDEDGEVQEVDVEWRSSDPSVIEIVNGNLAVGRGEGTAVITASAASATADFPVTVEFSKEAVTISNFVETLATGSSFVFGVNYIDVNGNSSSTAVTWESSVPEVATVDATGQVDALSEGTTVITAMSGNVSDQITLTVSDSPVITEGQVRITAFETALEEDQTFTYQAIYIDENNEVDDTATITWASGDPTVLSINQTGSARAEGAGSTQITASVGEVTASLSVDVSAKQISQRTGTLRGTGYDISGSFRLFEDGNGDLILEFEDALIDNNAPGPYYYLSNQDRSISGGVNLGKTRNGSFQINISDIDSEVAINSFENVLVWCEPFNVRLGI
ncbi:MAG: Ig-like domain-containing protein, partial [Bacteroidota bacterium]